LTAATCEGKFRRELMRRLVSIEASR